MYCVLGQNVLDSSLYNENLEICPFKTVKCIFSCMETNIFLKYCSLILVRTNKSVCVYSRLMHHRSADMLTLEPWLALIRPVYLMHSISAVCIWKFSQGSCPVPAEGYLPTAVIVCNYRTNLFSPAGFRW